MQLLWSINLTDDSKLFLFLIVLFSLTDLLDNFYNEKNRNQEKCSVKIYSSIKWLGHVRRMEDGRIPKDFLYAELKEGRRKVGMPSTTFQLVKDVVKRDLKRAGIGYTTWEYEAEDSDNWKSLVKEKNMEGEEGRRNTMMLKRQRRKACEAQPPLTFMSYPHCLTAFDTQRDLYLHLRTRHSNKIDWNW